MKGKTLNKQKLSHLKICIPPLPEQRRIAEILGSVDEAIAATQALIDQTRTVKQTLLQHLLTKGIGHTRFKQTEIGEIPEAWEVVPLEQLLAAIPVPMRSGPFGSALKKNELVDSGIPFLGIDNIHVERFSSNFKRYISENMYKELRKYSIYPNDVAITIMGTVGRCCVIPSGIGPAISSKHIWVMSFDSSKYISHLICWQMNFAPWVLENLKKSSQGGIMAAINSQTIKSIQIPMLPMSEQIKINDILSNFNDSIDKYQKSLGVLNLLKSALLTDLLSGRTRVPVEPQ